MEVTCMQLGMLQTNCYVVTTQQNNAVVIDPAAQADRIGQWLEDHGCTLKLILLTHGHFDHVGAVNALKERYGAKLYAGPGDFALLRHPKSMFAYLKMEDESAIEPDGELEDGMKIALDELTFSVLETPGHTPGGVCIRCGDALFTGDTLFRGSMGRTDLEGGDHPALMCSLERLAALEGDFQVYPGHGDASTLERERRENPYLGAGYDALS